MAMAGWEAYNLTTIHQPIADIILKSIDLIVDLTRGKSREPTVNLFACSITERATLRPLI